MNSSLSGSWDRRAFANLALRRSRSRIVEATAKVTWSKNAWVSASKAAASSSRSASSFSKTASSSFFRLSSYSSEFSVATSSVISFSIPAQALLPLGDGPIRSYEQGQCFAPNLPLFTACSWMLLTVLRFSCNTIQHLVTRLSTITE